HLPDVDRSLQRALDAPGDDLSQLGPDLLAKALHPVPHSGPSASARHPSLRSIRKFDKNSPPIEPCANEMSRWRPLHCNPSNLDAAFFQSPEQAVEPALLARHRKARGAGAVEERDGEEDGPERLLLASLLFEQDLDPLHEMAEIGETKGRRQIGQRSRVHD